VPGILYIKLCVYIYIYTHYYIIYHIYIQCVLVDYIHT
jgi:hypothetical protein